VGGERSVDLFLEVGEQGAHGIELADQASQLEAPHVTVGLPRHRRCSWQGLTGDAHR
jgi:hypothetical protein